MAWILIFKLSKVRVRFVSTSDTWSHDHFVANANNITWFFATL